MSRRQSCYLLRSRWEKKKKEKKKKKKTKKKKKNKKHCFVEKKRKKIGSRASPRSLKNSSTRAVILRFRYFCSPYHRSALSRSSTMLVGVRGSQADDPPAVQLDTL